MSENEESKLAINDIKRHSFESAKQSLRRYAEENQGSPDLVKVPTDSGLFGWFDHKVTGDELNELTAQIQDYFIRFNQVNQGMFKELVQVYKALDALDKDYITAIVDSIKATEKVNNKAKKNRQDIEDSVANQEKMIEVLKNFKKKLEKLEHLTDVDRAWKMLSEQQNTLLLLIHFKEELTKIEHIDDVDAIWTHQNEIDDQISEQCANLVQVENAVKDIEENLAELVTFRENLGRIQHLGDIDSLWGDVSEIKADIISRKKELATLTSDFEAQRKRLGIIEEKLKEQMDKSFLISGRLDESLEVIGASIAETKENIVKVENKAASQKKLLEETKVEIDDRLSTLEQSTAKMIEDLRSMMADENSSLVARCEKLSSKVKYAFWLSGGTIAITVVHFALSLMGVL